MIAMEVAHHDEVSKMLLKPGQTNVFTAAILDGADARTQRRRLCRFSRLAVRFSSNDFAGFFLPSFFRSIPLLISLPSRRNAIANSNLPSRPAAPGRFLPVIPSVNRIGPLSECPVVITLAADAECQGTAEIALLPQAFEYMAEIVLRLPVQV